MPALLATLSWCADALQGSGTTLASEPLGALRDNGPWLAHIHLADTGRLNPGTGRACAAN